MAMELDEGVVKIGLLGTEGLDLNCTPLLGIEGETPHMLPL
jgi:hypothetical protein